MVEISSNHPFITTAQDVSEIAKPLRKLGITYFTYTKTYLTGERIYLGSVANELEGYLKQKWYLSGNTECSPKQYKPQMVLWETLPNQAIFDANARAWNIDHGMFMIKPHEAYNEYFAFATTKGNQGIVNTYLTNMDVLENFTKYFQEKADPVLQLAEKNKLLLPFNNSGLTIPDDCNSAMAVRNILSLSSHADNKTLTKRQLECCSLLIAGKKAREISDALGLSVRTVEYYLDNVKLKLKCNNKAELIAKLSRRVEF